MAGKKGKSKNHREKRQNQQFNQSQQVNRQQVNVSQVACSLCATPSEPGENFVQCDECKLDFHFNCVGITNIGDEDEWRCNSCLKKNAADPSTQDEMSFVDLCDQSTRNKPYESSKESLNNQSQTPTAKVKFSADVHQPRLEDVDDENEIHQFQTPFYEHRQSTQSNGLSLSQPKFDAVFDDAHTDNQQSQSNGRQATHNTQQSDGGTTYRSAQYNDRNTQKSTDDVNRQSTQSVSIYSQGASENANKPNSIKSLIEGSIRSVKSISSISSSKELHLRHAKDQYDLQERIDNEILDAKLEAIKAKEARSKRLLEEIYKSKSERHSSSSIGSVKTSKSHVSTWVKDQQQRVESKSAEKIVHSFPNSKDLLGMDVSISMNNTEIENIIRKQVGASSRQWDLDRIDRISTQSEVIASTNNVNRKQWDTKTSKSEQVKVPISRSTMLPHRQFKNERPTYRSFPPNETAQNLEIPPSNPSGMPNSSRQFVKEDLDNQLSFKRDNVHPKISETYRSMYPSYTESQREAYHSPKIEPTQPFQPIYTSVASMNPIVSSTVSNPVGHVPQTLNDRTFPMYRKPSNTPFLTPRQIAARQALPKWLPKFNGNPVDWPNFITRYENTTALCGYCLDENLERLEKCLEEPAKSLVKSQLMMPECVPEIIQILFERFGRPELVMRSTLDTIRNEPIIKSNQLESLSDFGYKVHSACNVIDKLGLTYYLYNPELVQEILRKLPHQTKIDFAVYSEHIEIVTLRTLADWLRALSRMINRISPIDVPFPSNPDDKGKNDSNRNQDRKNDNSNSKSGYLNIHDEVKSTVSATKSGCVMCDNSCKRLEDCSQFKQLSVNQRWDALKQHNLCRRCLKQHSGDCVLSKECGINGCVFKHNSLLHSDKKAKSSSKHPKPDAENANQPENVKTGSNNTHFRDDKELFRTALVEVHHNNRKFATFALLDEASSFTLMEKETAEKLNVTGTPETICMLWTKGMHRQEQSEIVNLEISGKLIVDGKIIPTEKYPLNGVNIVEKLELPEQSLPIDDFKRKYKHLTDLPIIGYENAKPTILIGIKNARLAVPIETIEGGEDDPIATRSRLGWQVYGTSKGESTGFVQFHRVVKCPCQDRDEDLHRLVKKHFTIENFGVVPSSASLDSKENERALKLMKQHTIRKGDRFETKLLWKSSAYSLPDSFPMAMKRLSCLENKGAKFIETIDESIKDYMEKGYVSKLSESDAAITNNRTWYLPVFTVVHPKKPEKLRTVFDAAARVKGVSLNSVLFTGPDLSVSIVDILRRFREHRIGINGDIAEMYHQVMINEEDRNSQRFLWRNGNKSRKPDVYVMNVMTFGATCSPSLAQFVKNLNATDFQNEYPRAAEAIIRNHYIDDLLDGADSVEAAIQLLKDVKYVHKMGGFEIRKFKSNSLAVLEGIGENCKIDQQIPMDIDKTERVLGMFWDTKSDCFTFSLKYTRIAPEVLKRERLPTKRELLSLIMSIYDPLGLLSHYLIHVKILLQELWRTKIKWDDPIPENLKSKWIRWLNLLPNVERAKIPRWYSDKLSPKSTKRTELHVFVDAGDHAYSAAAYLRIEDQIGVSVSLVGSKARVTPLKYLSITRKELLASVLGTRFSQSIRDGLYSRIDRRIIWSDSITVLTWLQSEHLKYHQFVAHRIGEISEATELYEWRWVPSKQNVADEATKWDKIPSFEMESRWFTGPEFLKLPEAEWPKLPQKITPNGTKEEMKLSCSHSRLVTPKLIDINRFSKFERALRAVGYAIRWGKRLLAKVRKLSIATGPLTQEELLEAETLLYRQAQWEGFTDEMITLKNNSKNSQSTKQIDKSSSIYDCMPYLDERELLRVDGRIDNAMALTIDAKRPIVLPRNHRVTRLVMLGQHEKMFHRNHETIINELRQRFYIPRIRVAYRSVRWNCMKCKLRRCRPRPPMMADLPAIRFVPGIRAFTFSGVDFFGPMSVMIGRRPEKRWGVLFTCLTTRAIHIELASSLNTQTCIMKLRNFINLRGRPIEIYSDNGTNFQGANNELSKELEKLNLEELGTSFTSCYSKWKFNPPASPHMGGLWERMIRTVKECLDDAMTSRTPKEEVLDSLLKEIMNVVNSRPLTFVPLDSCESEALTPNHFILGESNGLKPPGQFKNDGPYLQSSWKEIQRCTNIFWKRFINEYVSTLTRRSKWFENVKPLEVGDIVIDFDENQPRNTYRKARIVETIIGSRDQVRRAKVQFSDGSALWRPAVRLGVLDINPPAPTDEGSLDLQELKTGGRNVGASNQNIDKKSTTALPDRDIIGQTHQSAT